ncbi:hypothetical protein P1P68_25375 [Streptomyces scabiei]|uniref:hypothetical protein n=1 Tax=Streptomyces scabiei TaxID=1930 RepID=UPI00298F8875|nr:hypothetical protein [Streptomyces scabiei]MDW8808023.1 hypothetical protein [Streptomyces scabiei]
MRASRARPAESAAGRTGLARTGLARTAREAVPAGRDTAGPPHGTITFRRVSATAPTWPPPPTGTHVQSAHDLY